MQVFGEVQFLKFSKLIYENFGIHLAKEKKDALRAKLIKLMSKNEIDSFDVYFDMLTHGGSEIELSELVEEITIHKTDFFRETNHFDFIKSKAEYFIQSEGRISKSNEIRVWSAGCSTGEEAYTLAIVLKECLPKHINIKILATDISNKVLIHAKKGLYPGSIKSEIHKYYLNSYFDGLGNDFIVKESLKELITFRQFNLAETFPFKNTFDIVFCRNVMIYFDTAFQQQLLDKFYEIIAPRGMLFIGHSESLANKKNQFLYVEPTIYMK
jgi:chemotaxis protein methyltransferase CheR